MTFYSGSDGEGVDQGRGLCVEFSVQEAGCTYSAVSRPSDRQFGGEKMINTVMERSD